MKIVIDACQASPHITGTDRMASNMLRELQKLDSVNQYVVFVNADYDFISSGVTAANFIVAPVKIKHRATWLLIKLPLMLRKLRADVFYSFHNFASPGIKACPSIVTILDTIPLTQQEYYFHKESKLRKFVVSFVMKRSLAIADRFLAISHFTKQSAVKELGVQAEKVDVVYLNADPAFSNKPSTSRVQAAREKYNLPPHYIFTIGANETRKNVASLVKAHRLLTKELRQLYPLIIAGAQWKNKEVLIKNDPYIRMAGFIDDADLPIAYSRATLFVFPSLYEGFGLPILEAMVSGTPVVTTKLTSIPEVAGNAAVYIDPSDPQEFANELARVLSNKNLLCELRAKGKAQAEKFSWSRSAEQLMSMFKKLGER
jgi:glycosyltransferase involved in cell wall biosynthesis